MTLRPRQPVPALEIDTVSGARWSLAEQNPERFMMLVFYRGLHCPICRKYTSDRWNDTLGTPLEGEPMAVGRKFFAPHGWSAGKHAR